MNYLKCIRCENTGKVDTMTLRRDGVVPTTPAKGRHGIPGTKGMPRYIALCRDCIRTENMKRKANEYQRASGGTQVPR